MEHTGAEYQRSAPAPGQDNDYVYGGLLGLNDPEIADLKDNGVI
jgi:crotonobetainyl-CoA:carnitine CoA-transferase CaiB-like acyl-CoA transferase